MNSIIQCIGEDCANLLSTFVDEMCWSERIQQVHEQLLSLTHIDILGYKVVVGELHGHSTVQPSPSALIQEVLHIKTKGLQLYRLVLTTADIYSAHDLSYGDFHHIVEAAFPIQENASYQVQQMGFMMIYVEFISIMQELEDLGIDFQFSFLWEGVKNFY